MRLRQAPRAFCVQNDYFVLEWPELLLLDDQETTNARQQ